MLIAIIAVAVVGCVPLLGGSYRRLARLQLHGTWLVTTALIVQIGIISVFDVKSEAVARSLHILTYVMLGTCLWLNRSVRWLPVVAAGWLANFIAIVANAGVMPTSAAAARALGRQAGTGFENSVPTPNGRLVFLGDTIVTPQGLPLANILSIGDVLLIAGLAMVIWSASRDSDGRLSPVRA